MRAIGAPMDLTVSIRFSSGTVVDLLCRTTQCIARHDYDLRKNVMRNMGWDVTLSIFHADIEPLALAYAVDQVEAVIIMGMVFDGIDQGLRSTTSWANGMPAVENIEFFARNKTTLPEAKPVSPRLPS